MNQGARLTTSSNRNPPALDSFFGSSQLRYTGMHFPYILAAVCSSVLIGSLWHGHDLRMVGRPD